MNKTHFIETMQNVYIRYNLPIIIPLILPLPRRRRTPSLPMLFPSRRTRLTRSRSRRIRQRRRRRTLTHSRSPDNVRPRATPLMTIPLLRAQRREIVPEVPAFGFDA